IATSVMLLLVSHDERLGSSTLRQKPTGNRQASFFTPSASHGAPSVHSAVPSTTCRPYVSCRHSLSGEPLPGLSRSPGVKRGSHVSSSAPVNVDDSTCTRCVKGSTVMPPVKLNPLMNGVDVAVLGLNDTTEPPDASKLPSVLKARSIEPNDV